MSSALRAVWRLRPSLLMAGMRHALAAPTQPLRTTVIAGTQPLRKLHTVISVPGAVSAGLTCRIQTQNCSASHQWQLPYRLVGRCLVSCQPPQAASVRTLHAVSSPEPWDSTWHDLLDELSAKGYVTGAGSDEWGASKRAVLAFARSADLLPAISLDGIRALVKTDIQYMDRKVRNARQRLSLLGGDGPTDTGTGEASFQDVMRLLMAIQLAGDSRTADNEAAGAPVLRQALECLRSQLAQQVRSEKISPEKISPNSMKTPASASRQQANRHTKPRQANAWEAAPWSKTVREVQLRTVLVGGNAASDIEQYISEASVQGQGVKRVLDVLGPFT